MRGSNGQFLPVAVEAFWHLAEWSEGCWEWLGRRNREGYGQFGATGSHRVAYQLAVGPIPEGLVIDHLCRNRGCVNPAHLEPVTRKLNSLRGQSWFADCAVKTVCVNGHPLDERNTYWRNGLRSCRPCNAAAVARRKARLAGAAS